jgi:UDP-N-acetylmuramate dehydrogenase
VGAVTESLQFRTEYPLQALNTFGLPAVAEYYTEIHAADQLKQLEQWLKHHPMPLLLLGGGSNLVLADRVPGLVARIMIRGWQLSDLPGDHVRLRVGAGENWHATVERSIRQGLYGLENLALIPGTVGAAPVQNIGAYGVELKDRISAVEVFDRHEHRQRDLTPEACRFGYRDSLFKSSEPERYVITAVEFCLARHFTAEVGYAGLRDGLGNGPVTPERVFDTVCRIRRTKLPDPLDIGNAGSFFKNPVVSVEKYEQLKHRFGNLVAYADTGGYKLAAGWLIDQCGLKGFALDRAGVFAQQALVLVNLGAAHREDIEHLSMHVQRAVQKRFGVILEPEPRFYP